MIENLKPELKDKIGRVIETCRTEGYRLEIFRGKTSPLTQAKLWLKSRCRLEIEATAKVIEAEGATYIANLLRTTEVDPGRRETDLLPGQSWHQYGEAADLRLIGPEDRVIWAPGHFGYELLAKRCSEQGLISGFFWRKKDVNHVQLRPHSVRAVKDWPTIDSFVRKEVENS